MLNAFFAGKGFYIVLLLCAVLVGASFWLVGRGSGADVERDPVKGNEHHGFGAGDRAAAGASPLVNTEEDERLSRSARASCPPREARCRRAQAPAVQEEMPDVPVSVNGERSAVHPSGKRRLCFAASVRRRSPMTARWPTGASTAAGTSHAAGEPVLAVSGGTVTAVYEDDLLGTVVEINHGNDFLSVYANLDVSPPSASADGRLRRHGRRRRQQRRSPNPGEEAHLHFAMRRAARPLIPPNMCRRPEAELWAVVLYHGAS